MAKRLRHATNGHASHPPPGTHEFTHTDVHAARNSSPRPANVYRAQDPEPPVDGYSMYDPSATGQDAAGSARLRRHMTAAVDAADGARWNTEVCGQSGSAQGDCKQGDDGGGDFARPRSVSSGGTGGTSGTAFSPPPPDMR